MRSPDNVERALRAVAVSILLALLWGSLAPVPRPRGSVRVGVSALASALERWTVLPAADTLAVGADTVPGTRFLDRLVALRRSGTVVRWVDGGVPATALALESIADPAGGTRAMVAAPAGAAARIADDLGAVDTVMVATGGVAVSLPALTGGAKATVGAQAAAAGPPDRLVLRRVVVLGRAGWESKFVIAALEERGWMVDARVSVAPEIDVVQGSPLPLDTARHSAVVVLDSLAAVDGSRIAAFAQGGGGVVLGPWAARPPALAALAAGRVGSGVRPSGRSFASRAPRRALPLFPLTQLKADAVVLEMRDGRVAAAARRSGAGRVVQIGYDETWRWRLGGGDEAPEAHRAWWAAVVAAAAYRPTAGDRAAFDTEVQESSRSSPRAAMFAALGAPVAADGAPAGREPFRIPYRSAAVLLLGLLLAEWASRRLRGAP